MSFKFILDIIIMVSFAAILFVVARVLPRVEESVSGEPELKTPWALKYLERADAHFKTSSEKFLRRVRVVLMRLDNSLSNRLARFKRDNSKNGGALSLELQDDLKEQDSDGGETSREF